MRLRALISRTYRMPLAEVGQLSLADLEGLLEDLHSASGQEI